MYKLKQRFGHSLGSFQLVWCLYQPLLDSCFYRYLLLADPKLLLLAYSRCYLFFFFPFLCRLYSTSALTAVKHQGWSPIMQHDCHRQEKKTHAMPRYLLRLLLANSSRINAICLFVRVWLNFVVSVCGLCGRQTQARRAAAHDRRDTKTITAVSPSPLLPPL